MRTLGTGQPRAPGEKHGPTHGHRVPRASHTSPAAVLWYSGLSGCWKAWPRNDETSPRAFPMGVKEKAPPRTEAATARSPVLATDTGLRLQRAATHCRATPSPQHVPWGAGSGAELAGRAGPGRRGLLSTRLPPRRRPREPLGPQTQAPHASQTPGIPCTSKPGSAALTGPTTETRAARRLITARRRRGPAEGCGVVAPGTGPPPTCSSHTSG